MTFAGEPAPAVKKPAYLPNLLSSLRIVLAPAILGAAYSNSRVGFTLLVAVALATDALDGFLARRWSAETALGRRLDRWGDVLTMSLSAVGVSFIWPNEVEQEWIWVLLAFAGYAADGVRRFVQPTTVPAPNWILKALGWLVPLALAGFLIGGEAWPFHAAAVLQAVVGGARLTMVRRERAAAEPKAEGAGL